MGFGSMPCPSTAHPQRHAVPAQQSCHAALSALQEIKEAVELPLTHPELYEDIGIKPPKVRG